MKKVGIITDSHSSISQETAKELGIQVIPMPFYFGEECYYEGVNLTRQEFFKKLSKTTSVTTSQPSPADVMEIWNNTLKEYDEVVYIPLSSSLSSSYSTAYTLSKEEPFMGKVFVVDNGRVATPMHRSILDAIELANEGYNAKQIKEILEKYKDKMNIYIAVDTFQYLKQGGRVTAATASLGSLLNIKPVLTFNIGKLNIFKKCRGMKKAKKVLLEAMQYDLTHTFKDYYEKGEVYLLAASSADEERAAEWVQEIKEFFPGMDVMYDDLSLGVSCHIGPNGLGIGCSCRPQRPTK